MRRFAFLGLGLLAVLAAIAFLTLRKSRPPRPVTLTYWGLGESPAVIQPLIDQYQADHPQVTINYVSQSPIEYRERLQNQLSQKNGPDLFRFHNTWLPMLQDYFSPLPPSVYSRSEFSHVFYPTAYQDLSRSGQIFALPLEFDGLAMVVNENLLAQNHRSVPTNWDELRQTAIAVSKCDTPDGTCSTFGRILLSGVALGTPENIDHWQDILSVLFMQNGVNLAAPQGKSAEDVLDYFSSFVKSHHVWDNTLPSSTKAFVEGKIAIVFAPSWKLSDILSRTAGFKVGVYPLPQVPVDLARGETPTTWASYWAGGVSKVSSNQEAAWDFLKFLSSPNAQLKRYQLALASRPFGAPYSRVDLKDTPGLNAFVKAYLSQAPFARSWYLASDTFDGDTGINTRLSQVYSPVLVKLASGNSTAESLRLIREGTSRVLSDYGLAPRLPTGSQ